jgi:hypothetical protein
VNKKVEVLSILFYVYGGLCLAGAVLVAIVGILGSAGVLNPEDTMEDRVGGALGSALITVVAGSLAAGHLIAATALRRLRSWARTMGMVMGILDIVCCCGAPLATALGAYALVVLLDDEVVALFPTR